MKKVYYYLTIAFCICIIFNILTAIFSYQKPLDAYNYGYLVGKFLLLIILIYTAIRIRSKITSSH
ncbi:hypothetical protein FHR29_004195 [Sphingobacterium sp. JUb56]|nr:hypothetical protein [Sphingobacterium sp. JUb56]